MTLKVTFELDDKDLKYFRSAMRKTRETAVKVSEEEVIAQASAMIEEVRGSKTPNFVLQRVDKLASLIEMLGDDEWALEAKERTNVVAALAYFADPQDIIPDSVPVIGYIDDAIMIELVVIELKHEIEAFEDFCRFKKEEKSRNRKSDVSRADFLATKRRDLHSRMRRRRAAVRRRSTASSRRPRFRLF